MHEIADIVKYMQSDYRALLKRLQDAKANDKQRVTLYLSKSLYAAFKAKCGDLAASVVLEEILKDFVARAPEPKSKK